MADRARAQAATEAAAERAAALERRIEGYRDMLAQATEALAVANGRIEADAQDLSDALDTAAAASAQREQAQAEAQRVRARPQNSRPSTSARCAALRPCSQTS